MKDSLLFLGKFLRHGTAIASLAPSSRWLSRATVRNVDWDRAKILVELGAGTGPITRVLAAILADRGIDRVDHVISGLPVPSFPKDLQRDLFRVVKLVLDPAGTYNQI